MGPGDIRAEEERTGRFRRLSSPAYAGEITAADLALMLDRGGKDTAAAAATVARWFSDGRITPAPCSTRRCLRLPPRSPVRCSGPLRMSATPRRRK